MMRRLVIPLIALAWAPTLWGAQPAPQPSPSGQSPQPVPQETVQAQEQVKQILEQPMYNRWRLRLERGETSQGNQEYIRAMNDMIRDFLKWLSGSGRDDQKQGQQIPIHESSGGLVGSVLEVLFWLAVVALGVFLVFVLVRVLRSDRLEAGGVGVLTREQVAHAMETGQALAMPADRWMDQASQFADQQNLRDAFRALYLALLSGLHERRLIDFRRNHTNWIYVNHYRGPQTNRPAFDRLTELFDNIWYGLHQPSVPVLQDAQRQVARMLEGGEDA